MNIIRKKTIDTIPVITKEINNFLISFSRSRITPPVSQTVSVLPFWQAGDLQIRKYPLG